MLSKSVAVSARLRDRDRAFLLMLNPEKLKPARMSSAEEEEQHLRGMDMVLLWPLVGGNLTRLAGFCVERILVGRIRLGLAAPIVLLQLYCAIVRC